MNTLYIKKLAILALVFVANTISLNGQSIKDKFEHMLMSETFDSSGTNWEIAADLDNLFIIQEGEYVLNRKANNAPYAILSNYTFSEKNFRLIFSIRLEKGSNENSSLGVLFMAQPGASGGYIFEINHLQQYRIKQIIDGSYKYISNDGKNSGWVKSSSLKETNSYNFVDIKTLDGLYELYINNVFHLSFKDAKTSGGKLGLVIGPASKGRFDFMYMFGKDASIQSMASESKQSSDLVSLAESIINLKSQINTLSDENQILRKTIDAFNAQDNNHAKEKQQFESQIKQLKLDLKGMEKKQDSLIMANQELMKYKTIVAGNENSDLIISLSKSLKTEREENIRLNELLKQNGIQDKKSNNSEKTKPKDKSFTLPKEN
ncbi:MAG TPA: hypothetical protein PKM16_08665 [Bacteroidia bacterium]|nr:hypothetical protein [Bacteroidia bacterium]